MKKIFKISSLLLSFIIGLSLGAFLFNSGGTSIAQTTNNDKTYEESISLFEEAFKRIVTEYVDEKAVSDYNKLFYGAISGMLSSLNDPYSYFLDDVEWKILEEEIQGSFVGVGVYVVEDENEKGVVVVVSPIEGSPAYRMGIKPGDRILSIDGIETKGGDFNYNIDLIKGKEGTYVEFIIERIGVDKPIKIKVIREVVKEVTVKGYILNKKIALIKIIGFNEDTDKDLTNTLKELKTKGTKGYIIDLRDNPGGLLDSAVKCVDKFVDNGKICYTKGRYEKDNNDYYAIKTDTQIRSEPIIVLVNENSASASEIFAGAMKELGRAVIVGTKTFGKGLVQKIIPLKSSKIQVGLKLTIQKYFTPNGTDIDKVGIMPDIEVIIPPYSEDDDFYIYKIRHKNKTDLIKEFYVKNQGFNDNDINKFHSKLVELGYNISIYALKCELIKERNKYNIIPYDLENDIQLIKAFEEISSKV